MSTDPGMLLDRVRAATEDEYAIESELGRGGMAVVFLARDIALDRRVAIKVMLPELVGVKGIQDRFVVEARTAAHLDHPGIVSVYSVKQRAGLLFIVMKYIEGRTLDQVLHARGALEPRVVAMIGGRVADALHFAHGAGVIHRDVKPSNIIIDPRGRPFITDFGIAKVETSQSITRTGSMLGTPAYMSPEQCRGMPAVAASDQYALGLVMYEMLTGRMPFDGTIFELIHLHCHEPPPPIRDSVLEIGVELEDTVMRMLAKDPADRFASLADVAKRLGESTTRQSQQADLSAIAEAVAADESEAGMARRRDAVTDDIAGAATEVVTTPAPGLAVTPAEATVGVGSSLTMRATGPGGMPLSAAAVVWKSEDPTIATVDQFGLVSATSAGLTKITATSGLAFGRAVLNVVPRTAVVPLAPVAQPPVPADLATLVPFEPVVPVSPRAVPTMRGRMALVAAVVLLLGVAGYEVLHDRAAGSTTVPAPVAPAAKADSAPPARLADSLPVVAPPPAARTTGKAAAVSPVDSARKAQAKAKADSVTAKVHADSVAARCARLREQIAVGELTQAELVFLRTECSK